MYGVCVCVVDCNNTTHMQCMLTEPSHRVVTQVVRHSHRPSSTTEPSRGECTYNGVEVYRE
jgi:hypothetical protein